MIVRGTTPTVKYTFKVIDPENITVAYFTMWQGETDILEKDLTEATIENGCLCWTLTQEETLSLDDKMQVEYECRYKTNDGSAFKTNKTAERVESPRKGGVI